MTFGTATVAASPPPVDAGGGVRLSPSARRRLEDVLAARDGEPQAVWIREEGAGAFDLVLVDRDDVRGPGWMESGTERVPLVWSIDAGAHLSGALVDHDAGGFRVRPAPETDGELTALVERALEDGVNPLVASHGGRIRLVDATDGVVRVRMDGGCQGCTAARETLTGVVVRHLEHAVPGIRQVLDVTDHASGDAPFFAPGRRGGTALPVLPDAFLREACG